MGVSTSLLEFVRALPGVDVFFKSDMYWIDMDGLSFDEIAFILFRLGFYRYLLGMFPVLMVFLLEIV